MQYTTTLGSNPFGVLTSVVAPAILTNACSVLALGTSNRLARVVDRTRVVAAELAGFEPGTSNYKDSFMQLDHLQVRATSAEGFEAFLRVDRPICRRGSSIGDRLNRDLRWSACSLSTSRGARAGHLILRKNGPLFQLA